MARKLLWLFGVLWRSIDALAGVPASGKKGMMRVWTTLLVMVLVVVAVAGWFVYSGTYNIAATHPHTTLARWLFTTVRDQSINERAGGIRAPDLTDSKLIEGGARHYASTCAVCHGAPGEKLSEIAKGMNPTPPDLQAGEVQQRYTDAELYWIVEHGIRMTGMPAFGPTHPEKDLWAIVAFIKRLPAIKAEEYQSLAKGSGHHSSSAKEHSS